MHRSLIVYACLLFCSNCCNKKTCPGDEIAHIVVKISGMIQNNDTVTLYTLDKGKQDSAFIQIDRANPSFLFFPVNDFDDPGLDSRQFVIRYNNKSDTIHHITAVFRDVEIVCDSRWGCGRGLGKEKTTLKKLSDFNFLCRGKSYGIGDTLILD